MSHFQIPVELHGVLSGYFEHVWACSFTLQGEPCLASEVFHRNGFLPSIVQLADDKSRQVFNRPIQADVHSHEDALLGKTVVLPDKADLPTLLLLLWASEHLFQPHPAQTIELYPIYEYHWTPPDIRARSAWQYPEI